MPSCAFDKCRNHSRKDHKANGVTFHALPGEESVKLKWITVLRRQRREHDFVPTQHTRVCSMHFLPEHIYTTKNGYKKMKKNAVPVFRDPLQIPGRDSPSGLSDIDSSDLEETLNTPYVLSLKEQLREKERTSEQLKTQLSEKENACAYHTKQIRVLQKSNKCLSKKNMMLKRVLVKMKRTFLKRISVCEAKNDLDNEHSEPLKRSYSNRV